MDGWADIAFNAMNIADVGMQPLYNNNQGRDSFPLHDGSQQYSFLGCAVHSLFHCHTSRFRIFSIFLPCCDVELLFHPAAVHWSVC